MTEYDYSPEAFEAHIRKQHRIAKWVDTTNSAHLRNPFTPATPAVHTRGIDPDDDIRRDKDRSTKRYRSNSHADSNPRLPPTRSYTLPPQLNLPNHSSHSSSQIPSPTHPPNGYPYYAAPYPPKPISPRDSRHSSRSSSTTRLTAPPAYSSPQPPYSAPPYKPTRSQTAPTAYQYPREKNYQNGSYPSQVILPMQNGYPVVSPRRPMDPITAPQIPYAMYQTKETPIIKRLWQKVTGGSKQRQHIRTESYSSLHAPPINHRPPQRKRSTTF